MARQSGFTPTSTSSTCWPAAALPGVESHERPRDQPDRAGLDAGLRGVLPLRTASPPAAHQHLPDMTSGSCG